MYTKDIEHRTTQDTTDLQEDLLAAKEKIRETAEALQRVAYDVKDKAEEIFQGSLKGVKEKTNNLEDTTVKYIQENPLKTLGFALLAGAVIAQLLRK